MQNQKVILFISPTPFKMLISLFHHGFLDLPWYKEHVDPSQGKNQDAYDLYIPQYSFWIDIDPIHFWKMPVFMN